MKKNILKVAFVAAIVLVSGIDVFNSQKTENSSDVVLANVEALAMDEVGGSVIACYDEILHRIVFYCKPNMMMICYCDGLRPGEGWEKTYNPDR